MAFFKSITSPLLSQPSRYSDQKCSVSVQDTKTSTVKSWWRFRSDEKFDSIHMVLRKTELELYDFKRDDWVGLMEEITAVHK